MKKFPLLFLAFLLFTSGGYAQNYKIGAKGGINYTSLTGMQHANISGRAGLLGGVVFHYGVYQPIAFQPELLYSAKGFEWEPVTINTITGISRTRTRDRFHYLDLPLLFKFKKEAFLFEIGPQLSYLFRARSVVTNRHEVQGQEEILQQEHTITGSLRRFDYGGAAGFGFAVNPDLQVGLRYNAGLRPVRRESPANFYPIADRARNSFMQFSIAYFLPGFL